MNLLIVIPVKGYTRSIICDVSRHYFDFIPNSLYFILTEFENKSLKEITDSFDTEDHATLIEYFNFLFEKEYIFWCEKDELKLFPYTTLKFETPSFIDNCIVDVDSRSDHDWKKIISQLCQLNCSNLQIRIFERYGFDYCENIFQLLENSIIKNVEILMPYCSEANDDTFLREFTKKYLRLSKLILHSARYEKNLTVADTLTDISITAQVINSHKCCGIVGAAFFTVNRDFFAESLSYNTCLNKKISIDAFGYIRNCPSMMEHYGHIDSTRLKDVLNSNSFIQKWKIKKDDIKVCRDCEFRHIRPDSAGVEFALPGITKNMVDKGVNQKNLSFVEILILAQFALLFGKIISEFIRNTILLSISNILILKILSAFWIKLMKLPLRFFDTRNTGDILQRNYDNDRIKIFLTEYTFGAIYSVFTFIVFTIILLNYSFFSFLIFLIGTTCYFSWIFYFLKKRRVLDNERFEVSAKEQDVIFEMVLGMHEIKLHNCENRMQHKWQNAHVKGMANNVKSLKIAQVQSTGSFIINELKNALIILLIAASVIKGDATLGTLLAATFILGQLQAPIEELILFIQHGQDVQLSLRRLNEIHSLQNEEKESMVYDYTLSFQGNIKFENVSFSYDNTSEEKTLKNINLEVPFGKTTAIVGSSGSGKTTLIKMLLHYFDKYEGAICLSGQDFSKISPSYWRSKCSSVMQNSFIFNDTIEQNIALNGEAINYMALIESCKIANIYDFITSLPLGFN